MEGAWLCAEGRSTCWAERAVAAVSSSAVYKRIVPSLTLIGIKVAPILDAEVHPTLLRMVLKEQPSGSLYVVPGRRPNLDSRLIDGDAHRVILRPAVAGRTLKAERVICPSIAHRGVDFGFDVVTIRHDQAPGMFR